MSGVRWKGRSKVEGFWFDRRFLLLKGEVGWAVVMGWICMWDWDNGLGRVLDWMGSSIS